MLARSAGRRQRRQTSILLSASFAQLQLPWLAPAQLRWSASQAAAINEASSRRRKNGSSRARHATAQTRQLATAADTQSIAASDEFHSSAYPVGFRTRADSNVPWDIPKWARVGQLVSGPPSEKERFSILRPYSDPIIINHTLEVPQEVLKIEKGLHGTTSELLQHLHTSLRVNRFDRAEAIIHRLAKECAPFAPELIHAHTVYLEEQLRTLASQTQGSTEAVNTWTRMRHWLESEVRDKGVSLDAKMFITMIRGAIRALRGKERDNILRHYTDWAGSISEDMRDEVLFAEDYDDNEFTILGAASTDLPELEITKVAEPATDETPFREEERLPNYVARTDVVDLAELPEVSGTSQKGSGLAGVKQAMTTFLSLEPLPADAPLEAQRQRAQERQRLMEETAVDIAIERWRADDEELRKVGISTVMQSRPMGALMWQWYQALLPVLRKELKECKKLMETPRAAEDDRLHYTPFLESLPIEKIAANTILYVAQEMVKGQNRQTQQYESEMKLANLIVGLGKTLELEVAVEASKKRLDESSQAPSQMAKRLRQSARQKLARKSPLTARERTEVARALAAGDFRWPLAPKAKLGAMLVQKLIETAYLPVTREHPRTKESITQMQPAFLHRVKYVLGRKLGVITPNQALITKLQSEPVGSLIAKRMPMVVEPVPWSGWDKGGYVHYPTSILRQKQGDKSGKDYFMAAARKGDMSQVYAGLTALGKVPWKIHTDVFRVQLEAWNSGEEVANFAPLNPQMEVPPEPPAGSDLHERRKWLNQIKAIENKRGGIHSKRCFQNFQMEIARAMVNETIYLPHNMDFRGRAYPIPPYFNHMGADNVRALFVFAEGKPLGETGLRWLKIHLATVAGHDKASMTERIQFTEDNLENIYDSVRDPLHGRRWWLKAEDAWQTLAACFELTKALDSPDPTKFVSHLPIQQDGTCNGLQHYAALGGDEIGARQVNLEPGDRPADVYTAVALEVQKAVERDAEAGNKAAQLLNGRLTRKCVKQPVMTNVYGVTFHGAKEQVRRQLEVLFPEVKPYDQLNHLTLSIYVTMKIFQALGSMFSGAQAIQHWLGQCADRIALSLTPEQIEELTKHVAQTSKTTGSETGTGEAEAATDDAKGKKSRKRSAKGSRSADIDTVRRSLTPMFRSTIVWTTPLRLPVVQPYRASTSKHVKTNLQTLWLEEPHVWDPVSRRKQLQGFPPNFIHSLDATHMLLSALKCNEVGMTFAAIHDSFWTHAADVDRLNILLRDAFVEMHGEDIIGRLREELITRYKGHMYLASVHSRSEVGKRIAELRDRHSAHYIGNKTQELAVEVERLRLLASDDPEEVKRGEAMVTPGSIVANASDESAFAAPTEMTGRALGDVPEDVEMEEETVASNSDADAFADPAVATDADVGLESELTTEEATEAAVQSNEASSEQLDGSGDKEAEESATSMYEQILHGKKRAKKTYRYPRKTHVWLPVSFPPVPNKGSFDVTRLKKSTYFFH